MNPKINILRIRKKRPDGRIAPGVGRRLSVALDASVVTASHHPKEGLQEGAIIWNYGVSKDCVWRDQADAKGIRILNKPETVRNSVNKCKSLWHIQRAKVPCLHYTTNREVAGQWLTEGKSVIVRHIVNGKRGNGIECVNPGEPLPEAPLYTQFYDKTHEFRVHVFDGRVIDYVQKKRMGKKKLKKLSLTEANSIVRNHKRGWVFARKDIFRFPEIEDLAIQATRAVGLDICAVDILAQINEEGRLDSAVVCETNSAPGMSDKNTFNAYVNAANTLID